MKLNKLLPELKNPIVKNYYLTESLVNFWVIAPVWFFIFRHFVTVQEIGFNEVIVFTIGFLFEIPSGALADYIGRRKVLMASGILLAAGSLGTALSFDLLTLVVSQSLVFIGFAFYSGANDSLVYDSLGKNQNLWHKITAAKTSLTTVVTVISVIIGGLTYNLYYRLPFILFTIAMLLFTFFVSKYPEELKALRKNHLSLANEMKLYLKNTIQGSKEILQPNLKYLIFGILPISGIYYAYSVGVIRHMILSFNGYEGFSASILSFILHVIVAVLFVFLPKLYKNEASNKIIMRLGLVASIFFALFSFKLNLISTGLVVIAYSVLMIVINWRIGVDINKKLSSKHRATALSSWAMLEKIPYIFIVLTVTNLSEAAFGNMILILSLATGFPVLLTLGAGALSSKSGLITE